MQNNAYTRNIFSGNKLKLKTFMPMPSVYYGKSTVGAVSVYPMIFIAYDAPRSMLAENKNFRQRDAQFKVTPKNFKKTLNFFRTIYSWFTMDEYKDLFIIDDHTGKMIPNMDFRNLRLVMEGNRYESQALLAVPIVVEYDSIMSEGIALSINSTDYTCPVTATEIEDILGILENFSFQAEAQLLLSIGLNPNLTTDQQPTYGNGQVKHKVEW